MILKNYALRSAFVILSFALPCSILAQAKFAKIKGTLLSQSGEPISYSTAALYNADSALIKGAVSDFEGNFLLENVSSGNYYLMVQNLEYATYYSPTFILAAGEVKDFGAINLSPSSTELEAVTVAAKRQLVEVHPDRMVFNVSSSFNSSGISGLDLLRKAPGVLVDPDNNVILQGKSGVRIFINGRPSRLSGSDLAVLLESMQSDNIELIELITNPSAKYEAEGNAGIINIKLKNNINLGYNGNIVSSYSKGTSPRMSNGATFNYGKGKLGVSATATRFDNIYYEGFDDITYQSGYSLKLKSEAEEGRHGYNFNTSITYDINAKHSVNLSGTSVLTKGDDDLFSRTDIINLEDPSNAEQLRSQSLADYQANNYNYNLSYLWDIGKKSSFSTDVSYGSYVKDNTIDQPNSYYNADGSMELRQKNNRFEPYTNIDLYSLKVDYERSFERFSISTGAKYYEVDTRNEFFVSDVVDGEASVDDLKSNTFNYTEKVAAAYIITNFSLFEKLKVNAGLRVENTTSQGILESKIATADDNVKRDYLNYFPNVSVSYALEKSQFSLGFGKRITRPNYQDLNPFESKTSELVIWKGNPFLNPNFITNYQLTYTWNKTLVISNTFSITEGYFARILQTVDETSTFIVPRNMRRSTTNGLSISYPLEVNKWWEVTSFINYNRATYDGDFDNATIAISTDIYNFRIQNAFQLPWDLSLNVVGYYDSPWIWRGSIVIDYTYGFEFGVRKNFFDDKLQVRLTGSDIFNTSSDYPYQGDYGGIDIKGVYASDNHRFGFGLTYNFGNQKIKNRKRKGGLDDELGRID